MSVQSGSLYLPSSLHLLEPHNLQKMEALYLLLSIVSTTLTSVALSILLIIRRLLPIRTSSPHNPDSAHLYQGTVWHERRRPVHHSFRYSVKYALIDLDRSPDTGHLSADEARAFAGTSGSVLLLTIPSSVGYEQNPLSVYYCYDELEHGVRVLKKCIALVTNTPWGEKVRFVFDPDSDLVAKPLHVSPFMDMLGNWSIKASEPAESLFIQISVKHPELGDYFTASLRAKRVLPSSVAAEDHEMFFWLMPHKVAIWIYWHAFKLWWKGVSFIQHPRYSNSNYKEDALSRDQTLRCCPISSFGVDKRGSGNDLNNLVKDDSKDRPFVWTDAKWPWS